MEVWPGPGKARLREMETKSGDDTPNLGKLQLQILPDFADNPNSKMQKW
jgi:hypothetical protein